MRVSDWDWKAGGFTKPQSAIRIHVTLPLAARGTNLLRRGSRLRRLFLRFFRLRRLLLRGLLRSHVWEENHVAYGAAVGQKHRQSVNADADASRRRHSVGYRPDVIFVHTHCLFVSAFALPR